MLILLGVVITIVPIDESIDVHGGFVAENNPIGPIWEMNVLVENQATEL